MLRYHVFSPPLPYYPILRTRLSHRTSITKSNPPYSLHLHHPVVAPTPAARANRRHQPQARKDRWVLEREMGVSDVRWHRTRGRHMIRLFWYEANHSGSETVRTHTPFCSHLLLLPLKDGEVELRNPARFHQLLMFRTAAANFHRHGASRKRL